MAPVSASTVQKPVIRGAFDVNKLKLSNLKVNDSDYEYDFLKPSFPEIKWEPLGPIEYTDKGLLADKANDYANLYSAATEVIHLTPKFGTEIRGVSLKQLNDDQKNELALLTATRGVVFFRDQKDLDIHSQLDLGRYWGALHRHATTALPKNWKDGLDEVHVIWADEKKVPHTAHPQTYLWHSDVSYEVQPPGYTSLKVLDGPESGGDTLWTSGYALYDALSPSLQQYLEQHTALHSANEQAADSRRSGLPVRREPIVSEHPLVRVHPVTGYKSVYVNPGFTRTIVGVPKSESDVILKYLFELIATGQENTVRFKWNKDDVAVWDNRVTVHSATWGFYPNRRHAVRVTTHGETPVFDHNGKSQQAVIDEKLGLNRSVDGSKGGNYND